MSQNSLPKSDGTTSTNYGPPFEISSTAIFILRCLKKGISSPTWINYTEYEPWDDIVGETDEYTICVQLKHNEKLDGDKLKSCLEKRISLLGKHATKKLLFVYFATTAEKTIKNTYSKAVTYPEILNLLLTNEKAVYLDQNDKNLNTYFCMSQNKVSSESLDIKQALADYIGQHHLTEEHLKDIQTKFMDYIGKRYLGLLKGRTPLTPEEIRHELAYNMLNKFKIEYNPNNAKVEVSNNFEEVLGTSSVIVFDHRWSSAFNEQIWAHLMLYLEKNISKTQLKTSKNELWMDGKLHMPLLSLSKESDRIILRALEIGEFKPKVIILRPRIFNIKAEQQLITVLQNLNANNHTILAMKTKDEVENFKFSHVNLSQVIKNRNLKLHPDSFTDVAKNYFRQSVNILENFVEAHDEFNYVNDFNYFDTELLPAIVAAIKIKDIPITIIQQLIGLGSNVNASVVGGLRPIFYAIKANRPDIVEILLKNEAELDPADKDGIRPLFIACIENKIEIAKLLIDNGADRNTSDFYGVRPLFMAYNNGNYEILKLLLKDFQHAAAANTAGSHILHKIAEDENMEGLKCILECCPDVNIFMTGDVKGKTPLDIANGNEKFCKLLEERLNIM